MNIPERLEKLKKAMKSAGVQAYYINTADFHGSEYVNDYFKVRQFFSGFTGSAGDLVVTEKEVGLWADGRYFVQAEKELSGSGIKLFKMEEEGVPKVEEYLEENLKKGDTLGFDGRTVRTSYGRKLKDIGKKKGFYLSYKKDLSEGIFKRPAFPASRAEILPPEISGRTTPEKLKDVREKLKKAGAESLFLSKLDDIAWLFNLRGNDVKNNPVLMAYAFVNQGSAWLFLQKEAVSGELEKYAEANGFDLMRYDEVKNFLKRSSYVCGKILIDPESVSYSIYRMLKKRTDTLIRASSPTVELKAVKNPVEIENMKKVYLKDSLALTRFIKKLTETVSDTEYTEFSASELLAGFRREIPEFRDLSFETIGAYGANAAMMHYMPDSENSAVLKSEGMFLVDSGGQYQGGTTDVTRTIVLGELSAEERKAYTLTAISNLKLLNAVFLYGCTGRNLDILAREPMWEQGMDYKCGTGHGVGYILNVHEGPQSFRWKTGGIEAPLEEGMNITDEPGVYVAGRFGVRIENVLLVVKDRKTADGQFMRFENLTFAPIDDKGIDRSMMSTVELGRYLNFQKSVYEALSPFLDEEEKEWLKTYSGI
ncbi:MAG: aminopeptidase P family protein [Lachnospiraceae bacterium]|nr:aminopeptidase P family protein [Lachnospiraceae bacterium]